MRVIILNLAIVGVVLSSNAQTSINGDLQSYVDSFIAAMPGSAGNNYVAPDSLQQDLLHNTLSRLLAGLLSEADSLASMIGYRIVLFTDTGIAAGNVFQVLEKTSASSNHWGMLIINPSAERPQVVLQSPHPKYDSNTGNQTIFAFLHSSAFAFFVSGTHRCNSSVATPCTGTTTVCSNQYRTSDHAHVVDGLFQIGTKAIAQHNPATVFIHLHGFAQDAGDPDLIISNGTRLTPPVDPIPSLRDNLLQQDSTLTFKIIHFDLTWTKLTAFSNTQGRWLNFSNDPCGSAANSVSGRFIHIEQQFSKLRSNEQVWMKMAQAIRTAFPGTTEVRGEGNALDKSNGLLYSSYPNPFNATTTIRFLLEREEEVALRVYAVTGEEVATLADRRFSNGAHSVSWNAGTVGGGVYFARLVTPHRTYVQKLVVLK